MPMGSKHAAIFSCQWDDPGAKWLRFRANKHTGGIYHKDQIAFYLGTGWTCKPEAQFTQNSFQPKQKIGNSQKMKSHFLHKIFGSRCNK